jgi:hypothetical protein
MYLHEQEEFAVLLKDLCISTNRPFDKDVLRVFLADLKDVPLQGIQRQAAIIARKGDKHFKSADLRPPAEPGAGPLLGFDNHAIIAKIYDHVFRTVWSSLSQLQRLYKHEWVFTRDYAAPRCVALRIHPDREELMIGGELRTFEYPGYYVRYEDCDLGTMPTRETIPLQERGSDWNEADAARDLLNR